MWKLGSRDRKVEGPDLDARVATCYVRDERTAGRQDYWRRKKKILEKRKKEQPESNASWRSKSIASGHLRQRRMCLACEVRQAATPEDGAGPWTAGGGREADADVPAARRPRQMGAAGDGAGPWMASVGRAGRSGGGGSTRWSGAGGGCAGGEERRRRWRASGACARARSRAADGAGRGERGVRPSVEGEWAGRSEWTGTAGPN